MAFSLFFNWDRSCWHSATTPDRQVFKQFFFWSGPSSCFSFYNHNYVYWQTGTLSFKKNFFFTCWEMNYSDRAVCCVDMLASSSTRSLGVNSQVLLVNCERYLTKTCRSNNNLQSNIIWRIIHSLNKTFLILKSKRMIVSSVCCTSVGWGSTATVMVLVCIRPCFSVLGTLWTRWTPPSNFIFL